MREARAALPQVRFTLDIKQAMRSHVDPLEMGRAMGDALFNVHVCDWNEDRSLALPGNGIFDFQALGSLLREIGYDRAVVLEPYLRLVTDEDALLRSITFLRNTLGIPQKS